MPSPGQKAYIRRKFHQMSRLKYNVNIFSFFQPLMVLSAHKRLQIRTFGLYKLCTRRCCFTSILLLVLCLVVTTSLLWHIPSRNVLLGNVLPGCWRTVSTERLLRIHQSVQLVDVGVCPQRCKEVFTPTVKREDVLKRGVKFYEDIQYDPKLYKNNKWMFLPLLNKEEKIDMIHTLDVMAEALTHYGLQYFLVDGTLLGVVRHRGVVPWDDDIDVGVNGSEWQKVKEVLCCVEGYTLLPRSFMHWKFFSSTAYVVRYAPETRFPFIDLFFYGEDDEYIWSLTEYNLQNLIAKKSDIFPLTTAILDGKYYPVPKNSEIIVRNQFRGLENCVSPGMFHKYNFALHGNDKGAILCENLSDIYPVYTHLDTGDVGR